MDRNGKSQQPCNASCVALRKESVDRNKGPEELAQFWSSSLSARRAWIEMTGADVGGAGQRVALRKESVDRNALLCVNVKNVLKSLSARRAWIEITAWLRSTCWYSVALRKESVDRNLCVANCVLHAERRSPQGERG